MFDKKKDAHSCTGENIDLLRNRINYSKHILQNNYKKTGILSESILNSIPSFYVTENFSVDIMHDAFEGIIKFGLMNSILYFIENNHFSLKNFNFRLRNFSYGEIEIRNRCEEIKQEHLKNKTLHLSARESNSMLHFFYIFSCRFCKPK